MGTTYGLTDPDQPGRNMAITINDAGRVLSLRDMPDDYRIGDAVLFDGDGLTFDILSALLGHWDKQWKELPRKPWHTGFLTRKDENGDWWVGQAAGGTGVCETRLKDFKEPYLVFRWFDTPPDEAAVAAFMAKHKGEKYDNFIGYANVILWFFISWWPFIADRKWMCWEFFYLFYITFGKPIDDVYKYPLITIIMDKLGYPGY
jgi:hypothetical protein